MTADELIPYLNRLIETCLDGEAGYREAAAHARNTQLQALFSEQADQRHQFVHKLREKVQHLGGTPSETGTFPASLHRGWLDLKSSLTGGSAAGLIAACETGDDAAQAEYQRIADLPLTGGIKAMVEKQYGAVKAAHAHLCKLKEQTSAGHEFPDNLPERKTD